MILVRLIDINQIDGFANSPKDVELLRVLAENLDSFIWISLLLMLRLPVLLLRERDPSETTV